MKRSTVLVVDDEERIRKLVGDFLRSRGFAVEEAADGREALKAFLDHPERIDLVILDVMMPPPDGWSVLQQIRSTARTPVLMLTARAGEYDQLEGFARGADDYVTKPFSPGLLVARVEALLRRTAETKKEAATEFDGLRIDEPGHAVYLDGKRLDLTPKEYDLFLYLFENAGVALTRERLLSAVWNYDFYGDLRTVDTHVKQLRAKLGTRSERIRTIRGVGYSLEVAP
jgi:two-component system, OmpR family, response regulator ResD